MTTVCNSLMYDQYISYTLGPAARTIYLQFLNNSYVLDSGTLQNILSKS